MTKYLACIKQARGVNQNDCRMLSKEYLKCRMERSAFILQALCQTYANVVGRNLMAPDEMKNLGFANDPASSSQETSVSSGQKR